MGGEREGGEKKKEKEERKKTGGGWGVDSLTEGTYTLLQVRLTEKAPRVRDSNLVSI